MSTRRTITVLSLCVLFASSVVLAADVPVKLPTWPKDFSLKSGERAAFGIPNPGKGVVKVTVAWTGNPLAIGAAGCDGTVVLAPASRTGPSYSFPIDTKAMAQAKSPVFIVSLEVPKALGQSAKAVGKISVESPAVDAAALMPLLKPFESRIQAKPPTQQKTAPSAADIKAAIEAKDRVAQSRRIDLGKSLRARAENEVTTYKNTLRAMSRPDPSLKVPTSSSLRAALAGPDAASQVTTQPPAVTPALRSVTPAAGMSGEQVKIIGVGLTPDYTEIDFKISSGTTVPGAIISHDVAADGTSTIFVQVPEKAGVTNPFPGGQIFAKALDRNPVLITNPPLSFSFTPVVAPSIVYVEPVEVGPGTPVRIDGNDFVQGDVIHFAIVGRPDYAAPTTFVNSARLTANVEPYSSKDLRSGSVYVAHKAPSKWVNTQAVKMVFKPSLPVILSLPASAEAGDPITISGISFGDSPIGEVHLVDHSGQDTKMPVEYWTDTRIIARTPVLGGFTDPQSRKVYVRASTGKSDPKPLALRPTMVTALMQLGELVSTKDYTFTVMNGADQFNLLPDANAAYQLTGFHFPAWFECHFGEDTFFNTRKLRNGWTVDSIEFTLDNAEVREKRLGTDSPYIKIYWNEFPPGIFYEAASYSFKIWITGPLGTTY